MGGIAALQFDTRMSAVDAVSSVEKFAALYSHMRLNVEQCCVYIVRASGTEPTADRSITENSEDCLGGVL